MNRRFGPTTLARACPPVFACLLATSALAQPVQLERVAQLPSWGEQTDENGMNLIGSGDVDGDGRREVIVVTHEQRLLVFNCDQAGACQLRPAMTHQADRMRGIGGMDIGDMNGDGRDDVILARRDDRLVLLANPAGGWTPVSHGSSPGAILFGPRVADVDQDGNLDYVVIEQELRDGHEGINHWISLYFGDGFGGTSHHARIEAGDARVGDFQLGDFNADGRVDIATWEASYTTFESFSEIRVRYGAGGSRLAAPVALPVPHVRGAFRAGDFDGDGFDDLVIEQWRFDKVPETVWVLARGRRESGFQPGTSTHASTGVLASAVVADVDADGRQDLVAMDKSGSSIHWRAGEPQGFSQAESVAGINAGYTYESSVTAFAVLDFNGDGRQDIVSRTNGIGGSILRATPNPDYSQQALPGAPTLLSVQTVPDTDSATVRIARAPQTGALPVLGYRVQASPAGPPTPRVPVAAGSGEVSLELRDTSLELPYSVVVRAYNAAGYGPPSNALAYRRLTELELTMLETTHLPEGDAGPVVHHLPVTLNAPARAGGVTFDVRSQGHRATEGVDYLRVELTNVHIPEGQSATTIPVTIIGDTEREISERIVITLHNIRGARDFEIGRFIDINDDEPPLPREGLMMIRGDAITEGGPGERKVLRFHVRLLEPAQIPLDFDMRIETFPGETNAIAGVDFDATPIRGLHMDVGDQDMWVEIPVIGDSDPEYPEQFLVGFENFRGGVPLGPYDEAWGTILDDDRILPPLVARDDRYVTTQNAPAIVMDPLANDIYTPDVFGYSGLEPPREAFRAWTLNIDTLTPLDNYSAVKFITNFVGQSDTTYLVCEQYLAGGRCVESKVAIVVRPFDEALAAFEVSSDAGYRDLPLSGLGPMPDARFEATSLMEPVRMQRTLSIDPTPASPWDGSRQGLAVQAARIEADGQAKTWRVLVDAYAQAAGEVDLYLGVDLNLNGQAEPGELRCTSAMSAGFESCELDLAQASQSPVGYWVAVHNRGGSALPALAEISAVALIPSDGSLVATGPGSLEQGEFFKLRLAWNDPSWLPGERRVGYVQVRRTPADAGGWVPVRLDRVAGAAAARGLVDGQTLSLSLAPNQAHERLFVDIPTGALALGVEIDSAQEVDLYAAKAVAGQGPDIAVAPPRAQATASSRSPGGNEQVLVEGAALSPGRWYLTPVNTGGVPAELTITATIVANAPALMTGSFFNPARSGHGLFLYPAGDQWAGLWYTYFDDASPTWLYLQGGRPGADGIWHAPIYRSSWNGANGHLVRVGEASVTPASEGAFRFTYQLDGETGSEPMTALGRGCPQLGGAPLDASSHWFNPARAGTGYSVQLFPNYEMFLAFVYDGQGVARFLIAEGTGFGGAERVLTLEQLEGFCPLCQRDGAPARRDVGTFLRRFGSGAPLFGLDALFLTGLPGYWTGDEPVQPLGGPGTTQGCTP